MIGKRPPTRAWTLREKGPQIAAAFRAGATYDRLARQFHCSYDTLQFVLLALIPFLEYQAIVAATKRRVALASPHLFRKGCQAPHPCPKGHHLSPATEFKAGCLRGMAARKWRPVGTVVVSTHRRHKTSGSGRPHVLRTRVIKWTDSPVLHGGRRWMSLARHLWERNHGPLPPGKLVVHADGDSMNDDPGNLVAVNRSEWFAMQNRILPGFARKRRRNHARWADGRRGVRARTRTVRAESRPRDVPGGYAPAHECAACGYTVSFVPRGRCPKCGGGAWERTHVLAPGSAKAGPTDTDGDGEDEEVAA